MATTEDAVAGLPEGTAEALKEILDDLQNASPGGAGGVKTVQVQLDWDSEDLVLVGVPIYTPAFRDFIVAGHVAVPHSWADGAEASNPTLHFGVHLDLTMYDDAFSGTEGFDLSSPSVIVGGGIALVGPSVNKIPAKPTTLLSDAAIWAMVDDGSGADPVLAQGQAVVTLVIAPAPE